MITISRDNNLITVINIFTVEESNQQKLVDMLKVASQTIMVNHEGFISSTIHKSTDGTMVLNYMQWNNKESFEKMLDDPSAIIHMNDVSTISDVDRRIYDIEFSEENSRI